ncbi:MAG: hypothetical protein EBR05_04585 [Marivivens sp.]|nr:hypothetical protein [Marivivens sp.]
MEQSLVKLGKIVATICFASFSTTSSAADLAQPKSEIILTVSGGIASTNADDTAVFDLDMIKELGTTSIETTTIWTTWCGSLGVLWRDCHPRLRGEP